MKPAETVKKTISLYEFFQMFPDEQAAVAYVESIRWNDEPACPHCGSVAVSRVRSGKPMPWRCRDCRKHFSVRTGTVLASSKLPVHKWLMAAYLMTTARKGISSVQMAKELGVTQKTAWFLEHRIREALASNNGLFGGPVEVDETYVGGKSKNRQVSKRSGRKGPQDGKAVVAGAKDRETRQVKARVVAGGAASTLHGFVEDVAVKGAMIYTDGNRGYEGMADFRREFVRHSVGEYVRGDVHTNSIESFWALLKRGYVGIYHFMSLRHLHRYVAEFAGRENAGHSTLACLEAVFRGAQGKRLTYRALTAK